MATALQAPASLSAMSTRGMAPHPPISPPSGQSSSSFSFSKSSLLSPLVLQSRLGNSSGSASSPSPSHFASTSSSPWGNSEPYGISSSRVAYAGVGGLKLMRRGGGVKCMASEGGRTPPTADTNIFVRMAWYGSEAFGKAVSVFRPKKEEDDSDLLEAEGASDAPVERKDAIEFLKEDLDRTYFVTGNMATNIYERDCEFADPFVSFKGLKRFKQNVSNLGSFMEETSLKVVDWQEYEDRIYAKWRFNCVLALPWRPILAASGSTEYFFKNDSGKIYKHVENWDISPVEGLKQLIRPNPKRKSKKTPSS